MGRKKIELKRIESQKERRSKYSKRKKGILKKAEELALLCDVDIIMVLVSPTDKPTIFHTRSRSLSQILKKFCMSSLQEREERRAYTIKTLKKLVYKNNTEVPIEINHLSSERDEVIQDDKKITELKEVKELLDEKKSILKDWEKPQEIDDLDRLNIMENYLVSSIIHIKNIIKIKIQEEQQSLK